MTLIYSLVLSDSDSNIFTEAIHYVTVQHNYLTGGKFDNLLRNSSNFTCQISGELSALNFTDHKYDRVYPTGL